VPAACSRGAILHPVRCLDPDQVEGARDHDLRRPDKCEPEGLLLALENAVLVVEAVEVVGDPDRVRGQRLRPSMLGGVGRDRRQLQQPLDQLTLLQREGA
jgi:hypothetical protein